MPELILIVLMSGFMEIIHIELKNKTKSLTKPYLSDKGSKVVMLKILWKDFIGESTHILYDKCISFLIPGYQLIIFRSLKKVRNKAMQSNLPQETRRFSEGKQGRCFVIWQGGQLSS